LQLVAQLRHSEKLVSPYVRYADGQQSGRQQKTAGNSNKEAAAAPMHPN